MAFDLSSLLVSRPVAVVSACLLVHATWGFVSQRTGGQAEADQTHQQQGEHKAEESPERLDDCKTTGSISDAEIWNFHALHANHP